MTLEQLNVVNYFVSEFREAVTDAYFKYSDWCEEENEKEKSDLSKTIEYHVNRALCIQGCANKVSKILGVDIEEVMSETIDSVRNYWHTDKDLFDIEVEVHKSGGTKV